MFIVGLPRSGTTLIEQILASHSQVFGGGEIKLAHDTMAALGGQGADPIEGLRQLDRQTAHRLASRHLERLRAFSPAALRIVDKMPDNYLLLGLLASLFPRAKFIHCRRDLRDVAVSCWMAHFQEIRWANDQQHIVSRFHAYQRIMAHWRKVLPVPLLEVDYEETVADLEGVARKLVAWCGLAWEPKCLEFHQTKRPVRTASAVQVRQPVLRTSVGRWKHYEQALAPLFARLGNRPKNNDATRTFSPRPASYKQLNLLSKEADHVPVAFPEIQVGEPVRYESLSVFPLFAGMESPVEYLLSDEGIGSGSVTVEEVSEGGSVPNLLVENKGDIRILFIEGEELVGAKQNRVLNTSVLIAAKSKVKIPVSCVEAGRWAYKSRHFGSSGSHSSSKLRWFLKMSVSDSLQ